MQNFILSLKSLKYIFVGGGIAKSKNFKIGFSQIFECIILQMMQNILIYLFICIFTN
jgi:hypothetical protein